MRMLLKKRCAAGASTALRGREMMNLLQRFTPQKPSGVCRRKNRILLCIKMAAANKRPSAEGFKL